MLPGDEHADALAELEREVGILNIERELSDLVPEASGVIRSLETTVA